MGRTQRFFRFRTLENLHKSRLFRVERSTKRFRFRVLSVEHHFEENKGRTEKLREDKNTNNSSIFRLFSVKNRGVSRVRMNHANLLKNGHFGEI